MHWRKRDLWKAGIVIAGMLLLLVLTAWIQVSAVAASVQASEFGSPGMVTVQATPTEDATVTALNKEKLEQEVQQLKNQNEPTFFDWLRGNVSLLLLGLGALAGFLRWLADRRDAQGKELEDRKAEREKRDEEQQRWLKNQEAEREKRAEERFQAAVTGLGGEKEGARIGAAILLRTFLRPGYEEFYIQTFDLAVANLRLRNVDPQTPEPLDTLSQALITVFKESFPLAREMLKKRDGQFNPQLLDASRIQLDNAFLSPQIDLKFIWMREAFLRKAHLNYVDLSGAYLRRTDLSGAHLREADLHEANPEDARSLKDTDLRGVKGLTKEQLEACKAQGAIIDEDATTGSPQPTVAPALSPQSNDVQTPPAPPAQGSTPTPDTGESNAPSSRPGPES